MLKIIHEDAKSEAAHYDAEVTNMATVFDGTEANKNFINWLCK